MYFGPFLGRGYHSNCSFAMRNAGDVVDALTFTDQSMVERMETLERDETALKNVKRASTGLTIVNKQRENMSYFHFQELLCIYFSEGTEPQVPSQLVQSAIRSAVARSNRITSTKLNVLIDDG